MHGAEAEEGAQFLEEAQRCAFLLARQRRWKVDGRRGARRAAEEARQGLGVVAGLYAPDIVDVAGVEELRAEEDQAELGLAVNDAVDAGWRRAAPVRAGEQQPAAGIAGR